MPLNHDLKYLFIHIPKTGGTTVTAGLNLQDGYGPDPKHRREDSHRQHLLYKEIIDDHGDKFPHYYHFTVLRNPYDRMVSEFFWQIRNKTTDARCFPSFMKEVYVHHNSIPIPKRHSHFIPQVDFTRGYEDRFEYFRFERLDKMISKLQIPEQLHLYKSPRHENYKFYYDQDTKEIVKRMFEEDLDRYNYSY